MIKSYSFLLSAVMLLVCLPAESQSKLILKDKFMYANSEVYNAGSNHSISSLIDTGCSFCIIDSIFAIDSCKVIKDELIPISVNQSKTKITSIYVDSISFCGITYHNVYCLVANLSGLYKQYAPKFIIGANILKSNVWKFDMKNKVIVPYNNEEKIKGTTYKWKNHKDYSDVALDYIIFDSKVSGKKTRFVFDTGSKNNILQKGLYEGKIERIKKETANIENSLSVTTAELCKNVTFEIGKDQYILDFITDESNIGLLNIEFLQGRSFILNYKKKKFIILEE